MKKIKNICIVSGSRAEYGLLRNLIIRLKNHKLFNLKLIATGTHLSKFHGNTYREILKDIKIHKRVKLPIRKDVSKLDVAKLTSEGIKKFSESFKTLKPDLVIILGDRYEIFAAAFSAMNMNLAVGHIHGGESTLGSSDDLLRHAITKMSKFHFVSTLSYKRRIIQLGENPRNVFYVGALAYEAIKKTKILSKKDFLKKLKIKSSDIMFLITYHPETSNKKFETIAFDGLLEVLSSFRNCTLIFTLSNADANSGIINKRIINYVRENPSSSTFFRSMGSELYYSSIKHCHLLIGNSSSGIIEAPYFNTPSVNIGDRQKGRICAKSVFHANNNKISVKRNINNALKIYKRENKSIYNNPYGKIQSSKVIINILSKIKIDPDKLNKEFYDINQ